MGVLLLLMIFYAVQGVRGVTTDTKHKALEPVAVYSLDDPAWNMLAYNHVVKQANRTVLENGYLFSTVGFVYVNLTETLHMMRVWIQFDMTYLAVYNHHIESIQFTMHVPITAVRVFAQLEGSGVHPEQMIMPLSGDEFYGEYVSNVTVNFKFDLAKVFETIAANTNSTVVVRMEIQYSDVAPQSIMISNSTYAYSVEIVPSNWVLGAYGVGLIVVAAYSTASISLSGTIDWIERRTRGRRR